jgi:hypothetical protein
MMSSFSDYTHLLYNLRDLPAAVQRRREVRRHGARDRFEEVRLLPEPGRDDILCLTIVRDEALRLPAFLDHYRKLGVDRFAIIENCSRDESLELLLHAPDVDVLRTDGPMDAAMSGLTWWQHLFDRYGSHRWYVMVDGDELLVYTDMERRNLHDLRNDLECRRRLALSAYMIDMYPDGPLDAPITEHPVSLIDSCPLFDATSYQTKPRKDRIAHFKGGPRRRLFGLHQRLQKVPFFRHTPLFAQLTMHDPVARCYAPPTEAALLHFKLMSDFRQRVDESVQHQQHWNASSDYVAMKKVLDEMPDLDCRYEGSRRYEGPESLVEAGFMSPVAWTDANADGSRR